LNHFQPDGRGKRDSFYAVKGPNGERAKEEVDDFMLTSRISRILVTCLPISHICAPKRIAQLEILSFTKKYKNK